MISEIAFRKKLINKVYTTTCLVKILGKNLNATSFLFLSKFASKLFLVPLFALFFFGLDFGCADGLNTPFMHTHHNILVNLLEFLKLLV